MKRVNITIVLMLIFAAGVVAQTDSVLNMPIDRNTKLITYKEVVEEPGDKDELFNRCVYWMNNFYKNPVAVTKVRDQGSGLVKGQHQFRVYFTDEEGYKRDGPMIMYDFIIELKEERYRYTVSEFVVRKTSRFPLENWLNENDPLYQEKWKSYLEQIDSYIRHKWIAALKKQMKPVIIIEEEEW